MSFTYEFSRPLVMVDCVVFGVAEELQVLLIQRDLEPFKDAWALPGGHFDTELDHDLESAARRELREETGAHNVFFEQLYTFSAYDRDPRGRTMSTAYLALVRPEDHEVVGQSDAKDAKWIPVNNLPDLAFDHKTILEVALTRLKNKVRWEAVGFELLPKMFTLPELRTLYEIILERPIDKRNFYRRVLAMGILREHPKTRKGPAGRPAQLYSFDKKVYRKLLKDGFNFEV